MDELKDMFLTDGYTFTTEVRSSHNKFLVMIETWSEFVVKAIEKCECNASTSGCEEPVCPIEVLREELSK